MKKKILFSLTVVLAMLLLSALLFGCEKNPGDNTINEDNDIRVKSSYKLVTLDQVYFPNGLLDTGFGMFIWDNTNREWVRTNTAAGKALFDKTKSTSIFAHGMGGNGHYSRPDYYSSIGYNVINFAWGAFSGETLYPDIAPKIWLPEKTRWISNNDEIIEEDIPNCTVSEMYLAFYYDLLSSFPDYSGQEINLLAHSYGGMLTMGVLSCLYASYERGQLPAYMLPDRVHLLDPFFSQVSLDSDQVVPWLDNREQIPLDGNVLKTIKETALKCNKYGTAIGLFRASKMVCFPCTQVDYSHNKELTEDYWSFCNNIVYLHVADSVSKDLENFTLRIHQYGWDWVTDYYHEDQKLIDAASTTNEEAYFFGMSYEAMFARTGTKYELDISGTERNTDDDVLTSFICDYNNKINDSKNMLTTNENPKYHSEVKNKIAGFAYVDANGNGKFDDRIKNLVSGVKVTITDKDGNVVYSGETAENGYYEKEVDAIGQYTVAFTAPEGCTVSNGNVTVDVTAENRQLCICNASIGR